MCGVGRLCVGEDLGVEFPGVAGSECCVGFGGEAGASVDRFFKYELVRWAWCLREDGHGRGFVLLDVEL